ncbi:hypothetical protein DO97_02770 [Neosynechococcus sphagnicola sy1]|uniref:Uncharacterized protein n=1 Tax=Neosynechococcus sphagnicola sy1 TaxID=1497020 RepID=A0A098TQ90_9CYAN|nr:hypothetical protein [Neosynechococcus sphagnicola]KGF72993.1 hypothetical protein DO97_02770 [Neosynechococcus sphagnicola sy1]
MRGIQAAGYSGDVKAGYLRVEWGSAAAGQVEGMEIPMIESLIPTNKVEETKSVKASNDIDPNQASTSSSSQFVPRWLKNAPKGVTYKG